MLAVSPKMVKVFSFCLYGGHKKYCQGLLENITTIRDVYPDFEIWVYTGPGIPETYLESYREYPQVKLIPTEVTGAVLMVYRYFPLDDPTVEVGFSRDADSRINERDQWCIAKFLASERTFHVIRDHRYHGMRIMGGMSGFRKGCLSGSFQERYQAWGQTAPRNLEAYNSDQLFLQDVIYPLVKDNMLIHSNYPFFPDEPQRECINFIATPTNFVGNVRNYRDTGEAYWEFTV